jgi:hypothetical protein
MEEEADHQQGQGNFTFGRERGGADNEKKQPAQGFGDDADGPAPAHGLDEKHRRKLKQLCQKRDCREQPDGRVTAPHLKSKRHQERPRCQRAHGLARESILEHGPEAGLDVLLGERVVYRKPPVKTSLQPSQNGGLPSAPAYSRTAIRPAVLEHATCYPAHPERQARQRWGYAWPRWSGC